MPALRDQLFARVALESRFVARATIERVLAAAGPNGLVVMLRNLKLMSPEQISEVARRRVMIRLRCQRCSQAFGERDLPASQSFGCPHCGHQIDNLMNLDAGWDQSASGRQPTAGRSPQGPVKTWMPNVSPYMAYATGASQAQTVTPSVARPGSVPPPPIPARRPQPAAAGVPGAQRKGGPQRLIGQVLKGLRLESFLGRGAHAWVYKASHPKAPFPLAVKLVQQTVALHSPVILKRLEREATILRGVRHENLVRVFGYGQDQGFHFLAMEFVQGRTLHELLAEWGESPRIEQGIALFRQVLSGLAVAHGQGVIHRDLKPDNIMVSSEGVVKIMDFGLAREDEYEDDSAAPALTLAGEILGTPHYMSPEQANADNIDHRADVYAAGATFYHVFTGGVPFDDKRVIRIIKAHLKRPPEPPRKRNPEIPEGLSDILLRMLAKEPDARYQSCSDVLAALEPFKDRAAAPVVEAEEPAGLAFPEPALLALVKQAIGEGWLAEDRALDLFSKTSKLALFPQLAKNGGYVPADIDSRLSAARLGDRRRLNELEARVLLESGIVGADVLKRELRGAGEAGLARHLLANGQLTPDLAEKARVAALDYHALIEDMIFGKMAVRKSLLSERQYVTLIRERSLEQRLAVLMARAGKDVTEIDATKRDTIRYMLKKPLPTLKTPRISRG